ncbi:MAG: NAD(P)-dependent alcohol dehydrogenase [Acidimicrobiia bacterium]
MRAVVFTDYGTADDLELREVARPELEADEVLVRIHATSVNPYDWHLLTGLPYFSRLQMGLRKPKVTCLGADVAGTVESVGRSVTRFAAGDEVFGGVERAGGFAEYTAVPEAGLAKKPPNLTFEQAAAVTMGALTALQGLRDHGGVRSGMHVLINGASGGVGTFAVQIAKHLGAEVTGVCSTRNVELVRSLGADHVIDYTQGDFTEVDSAFDLMLDNVGNRGIRACLGALKPQGVYVANFGQPDNRWTGPLLQLGRSLLLSMVVSQKVKVFVSKGTVEDMELLRDLLSTGELTSVIDKTYPLEQAAEAMRYLEAGHARGKVLVAV